MTMFTETTPTLESFWWSIILFGRNVASYKFALGKSLLDLPPSSGTAERKRRGQGDTASMRNW